MTNRFVAQLASMGGLKYRYAKMALQLKDNSYFLQAIVINLRKEQGFLINHCLVKYLVAALING